MSDCRSAEVASGRLCGSADVPAFQRKLSCLSQRIPSAPLSHLKPSIAVISPRNLRLSMVDRPSPLLGRYFSLPRRKA